MVAQSQGVIPQRSADHALAFLFLRQAEQRIPSTPFLKAVNRIILCFDMADTIFISVEVTAAGDNVESNGRTIIANQPINVSLPMLSTKNNVIRR